MPCHKAFRCFFLYRSPIPKRVRTRPPLVHHPTYAPYDAVIRRGFERAEEQYSRASWTPESAANVAMSRQEYEMLYLMLKTPVED